MTWGVNLLNQLGFDRSRLGFAARTVVAGCVAMSIAWILGLDHPQWSAMTVWAASQPTRGRLFEKSFFRLAGTLSGAICGICLVHFAGHMPWVIITGLALWIAACAAIGNLQRGFVSYGTILAGYSAAMVVLLDYGHLDHALGLAADRILTILTGVASAMVFGALLTPMTAEGHLDGRLRRLTGRVVRALADDLAGRRASGGPPQVSRSEILSEIASIEDLLDPHSGGLFRARHHVRTSRLLLTEHVGALLWLDSEERIDHASRIASLLYEAAEKIETTSSRAESYRKVLEPLNSATMMVQGTGLADVLGGLCDALSGLLETDKTAGGTTQTPRRPVILHRDWTGAAEAGIRAFVVLMLVGSLWQISGIAAGAYLMLGTAIMISLFSTFDSPMVMMRAVLLGSFCGAVAAIVWRWLIWPQMSTPILVMIVMMPLLVIGGFLTAHRKTMKMSMDFNMVGLLLLQPVFPPPPVSIGYLVSAAGVVVAPLVALLGYRFVFPATLRRRQDILVRAIVGELQMMARQTSPANRLVWRARLYHRLVKLHRWAERSPGQTSAGTGALLSNGALAVLSLGTTVFMIQRQLSNGVAVGHVRRRLVVLLHRVERLDSNPEALLKSLERTAPVVAPVDKALAERLVVTARRLRHNAAFFDPAVTQPPRFRLLQYLNSL